MDSEIPPTDIFIIPEIKFAVGYSAYLPVLYNYRYDFAFVSGFQKSENELMPTTAIFL